MKDVLIGVLAFIVFVVTCTTTMILADAFAEAGGNVINGFLPTPVRPTPIVCTGQRRALYTTSELENFTFGNRSFSFSERVEVLREFDFGYEVVFCLDNFIYILGKHFFLPDN